MIDRAMTLIADSLGTDACIIIFVLIAVVPLWYQLPQTILEWQEWLSQTAIQLIALAVLAKVSKVEGKRQNKLIKETHDIVLEELKALKVLCKDDKEVIL